MKFCLVTYKVVNWSNGSRVMKVMCDCLKELGHEARLFEVLPTGKHGSYASDCPFPTDDEIVIYWESIANPLGAHKTVHWFGNKPATKEGRPTSWPGLCLAYDKQWLPYMPEEFQNDRYHVTIGTIEPWFNDKGMTKWRPKLYDCLYFGKAPQFPPVVVPRMPLIGRNLVLIDRVWPVTRETLRDTLSQAHTLFSLDNCSILHDEAVLCGCRVMLAKGLSWERFELKKKPPVDNLVEAAKLTMLCEEYFT